MIFKIYMTGLLCLPFFSPAQSPKLSSYELKWALGHPFAALKIKKITKKCDVAFLSGNIKERLDSLTSGGQLDAFRHVFYMAAYAQKIRVKKVRKLGRAHEKANYRQFINNKTEEGEQPDSLASVMDLKNNELGFAIGCNNRSMDIAELRHKVVEEIKLGKAVIFKRDLRGNYVDCSNRPLQKKEMIGQWYVPKCLVPSNYKSSS
jgi:hypothetical protein